MSGVAQIEVTSTSADRFPLNNFKYSLTLFSKFFSSFPHGTCSLSVSRQYLALDETYHPISAAIPNNSTRRLAVVRNHAYGQTGFSPSLMPSFNGLTTSEVTDEPSKGYNSITRECNRFST